MKLYRIYDVTNSTTVANAIPELDQALEVLQLYELDNPHSAASSCLITF